MFRYRLTACVILCLFAASNARASTVSLVPATSTDVSVGDTVTLDIVIDFSDVPFGTLGGGFAITYDPSALAVTDIEAYNVSGGIPFALGPLTVIDGLIDDWAGVGNINGLAADGPLLIGKLDFQILPGLLMGDSTLIQIAETTGIAGPWISAEDFVTVLYPEYNEILVSRVPLPAAVYYMLSGIGFFAALGRSKNA